MAISVNTIFGASLGFEYYPDDKEDEFVKSAITIDLLFLRIGFFFLR